MLTTKRIGIIALALAVLVMGGYLALEMVRPETEPLRIAMIPVEDADTTMEQAAQWIEHMTTCLDMPVELVVATDYTAVIEAMKYGHADVGKFGAFSYVLATQEAEVEAISKAVRPDGEPTYHACIIALADSGITSLEDLNGKTIAFTDPASTSGYLAPITVLKENGIELGETFFAGSIPAVIEAVKAGQVNAGACAYEPGYRKAIGEGVITEEEVPTIWISDPIPSSPIAVQKSMDPALKVRVAECVKATPREIVEMIHSGRIAYTDAQDSDYDYVRRMAEYGGED